MAKSVVGRKGGWLAVVLGAALLFILGIRIGTKRSERTISTTVSARANAQKGIPERAVVDLIESRYQSELEDIGWAHVAQSRLLSRLVEMTGKEHVIGALCKSATCRAEVSFRTMADAARFQRDIGSPERRPWNGEIFISADVASFSASPESTKRILIYIAREGVAIQPN